MLTETERLRNTQLEHDLAYHREEINRLQAEIKNLRDVNHGLYLRLQTISEEGYGSKDLRQQCALLEKEKDRLQEVVLGLYGELEEKILYERARRSSWIRRLRDLFRG